MPLPLLAPLITGIIEGVSGAAVFTAANNYLGSSPSGTTPQIPLGRKNGLKQSPKIAKKKGLSDYSDAINAGLAGVVGAVLAGSSAMSTSASDVSTTNKTEIDALKALNPDSPLLQNQLHLKQSVNDIVDAINSNTIASATFLAPINANLSAISSTLIAISSTLLEISENYADQVSTADDLPYVDSETFYDLLKNSDLSPLEIQTVKFGEEGLVKRLSNDGASYPEIKQAVQEYRKSSIPSADLINSQNKLSGVTAPSPINPTTGATSPKTISQIDYSSYYERMASHADSAKVVSSHLQTPQDIKDLDGNVVVTASPMQIEAIKHASDARHKTDTNNQEYDHDDFNNPFDLIPTLPFIGRNSVFDLKKELPSTNVFLDGLKSKFSSLFS